MLIVITAGGNWLPLRQLNRHRRAGRFGFYMPTGRQCLRPSRPAVTFGNNAVKIIKAYKTRIYPTVRQQRMLAQHFGCARFVYNYFLQRKSEQYKQTKKSDTYFQTSRELTKMKKQKEYEWLNDVSRQCVENSIRNLDNAFQRFFKKKARHPRLKSKKSRQSFQAFAPFIQVEKRGICIPRIGTLKCSLDGLPDKYRLLSVTVSQEPTGNCFVAVSFETNIPTPKIDKSKPVIGLDFGLKTFVTTSTGDKIEHPHPFKQQERKLRRLQRRLARRIKGSKRRRDAKRRIALLHERIGNRRLDFLHKLSRRMVGENQAIHLEDLTVKGMMNRFGKGMGEAGWGEFTRQLEYKGKWYGCRVKKIARFFPSSKTCSKCGCVKEDLTLSDRAWECGECHAQHDRDVNAAKNILNYGQADRKKRTGRVGAVRPLVEPPRQEQAKPTTRIVKKTQAYMISCAACDRTEKLHWAKIANALREWHTAGWRKRNGLFYCPDCAERKQT